MQVLNQGDEYDEVNSDVDVNESEEDTSASSDKILGLPKGVFFLGVAGLIVVVILLAVVMLWKAGKKNDAYEDSTVLDLGTSTTDDVVVNEQPTTTTLHETGPYYLFDSSQNYVGVINDANVGTAVMDDAGNNIGSVSDSGTEVFTGDGTHIGYVQLGVSGNVTSDTQSPSGNTDVEELRKLGYTGDEIEAALRNGDDLEALKESAMALRDEAAKEALERMADSGSDEYKEMVNNSVYCMPEYPFVPYGDDMYGTSMTDSYIVNADYEKVVQRGYQLFIKVKIANGTYAFMTVTPERWETLPDSGNIVLNIEYALYGSNDQTNMYITNISEISTTEITVNPQDSGTDLDAILSQGISGSADDTVPEEEVTE